MTNDKLNRWYYHEYLGKSIDRCNGELDEEHFIGEDGQADWDSFCVECKTYTMHRPHKPKIPDYLNDSTVIFGIIKEYKYHIVPPRGNVKKWHVYPDGPKHKDRYFGAVQDESLERAVMLALKAKIGGV